MNYSGTALNSARNCVDYIYGAARIIRGEDFLFYNKVIKALDSYEYCGAEAVSAINDM